MDSVQQTGKGLEWLIHRMFGLHPEPEPFTSVNERLDIFPNLNPVESDQSIMRVLVAGNRGHGCSPGVGGVSRTTRNLHRATDTSLFNPLPFAARPIDDDLTEAERARYCLRKRMDINAIPHFLYYGLRLSVSRSDLAIQTELITRVPGEPEVREPWVPDTDDLYPEPIDIPNQGAVTASNTVLSVRGLLRVILGESAISNFVEAVKLLYNGEEEYAIFSEFGLCYGTDRFLEVQGGTGIINFNESIGTTIYSFANDHKTVYMNTQSLELDFDVGNGIPLFAAESIPTLVTVP